jgi:hypothetical protein
MTPHLSAVNSDGLFELVKPADIVLDTVYTPHCPAAAVPASLLNSSAADDLN